MTPRGSPRRSNPPSQPGKRKSRWTPCFSSSCCFVTNAKWLSFARALRSTLGSAIDHGSPGFDFSSIVSCFALLRAGGRLRLHGAAIDGARVQCRAALYVLQTSVSKVAAGVVRTTCTRGGVGWNGFDLDTNRPSQHERHTCSRAGVVGTSGPTNLDIGLEETTRVRVDGVFGPGVRSNTVGYTLLVFGRARQRTVEGGATPGCLCALYVAFTAHLGHATLA
jgi:hypothetical protein